MDRTQDYPKHELETSKGTFIYTDWQVVNPDDYVAPNSFSPYNCRPFLIHNEYGTLGIVYADHLQDALDAMVDADRLDSCLVPQAEYAAMSEEERDELAHLGNAGEPFDLSYIGFVELPNVQYGIPTDKE